jgi:membrane protease YdiL (CAAX protease family)
VVTQSRSEARAPWRLIDLVIVVLAYIGLFLVLSLLAAVVGLIRPGAGSNLSASLAITIITDLVMVALIIWLVRRRGGHPAMLGFRPLSGNAIYLPAVGFLAALGILLAYTQVVDLLGLERLVPRNNAPKGAFDSTTSTVLFGALAIFVAPFAEEVIFRGFLLGGLQRWFPTWSAVLISGVLFGAVHAELGVIIPIALIGIVLAVVYLRANSIFASMGTHFIFNTVSFLATYLMERR